MPYNGNGGWDYEAAEMLRLLRLNRRGMSRVYLGAAARWVLAVVVVALFLGGLLAVSFGGHYLAGRALGAGVRDAVSK